MIEVLLSCRLGERRWTQAQLARKTGIRPSTISDLYNGFADRINLKHLDRICDVLGCEVSEILTRNATYVDPQPAKDVNNVLQTEMLRELGELTDGEIKVLLGVASFLKENRIAQNPIPEQEASPPSEYEFMKLMRDTSRKLINRSHSSGD